MGANSNFEDERLELEFTGFYMVNGLSKLIRKSKAGYCLVSFIIVAVPAFLFYITGLQPFTFVSLTLYGGVLLFFLLSSWVNTIAIKTSMRLVDEAEPANKEAVTSLIHRLMDRWFYPWWHLVSGITFISIAILLAVLFGHPEWLQPAAALLGFVAGVTIWLIGGTIYFWHNLATKVIGRLIPINPLNSDRMGGFRFIADHLVTWTIIESIRIAYVVIILMAVLWEVQIALAQIYFLIFFCLFVGVEICGYFSVVYDLHHRFVRVKHEMATTISSLLDPLERKVTSLANSSKQTDKWEQTLEEIKPYAQSVIAIKIIIDEYRYMREWPVDIPLILKVIFALLTPFLLLTFQWIIQFYLGLVLP